MKQITVEILLCSSSINTCNVVYLLNMKCYLKSIENKNKLSWIQRRLNLPWHYSDVLIWDFCGKRMVQRMLLKLSEYKFPEGKLTCHSCPYKYKVRHEVNNKRDDIDKYLHWGILPSTNNVPTFYHAKCSFSLILVDVLHRRRKSCNEWTENDCKVCILSSLVVH